MRCGQVFPDGSRRFLIVMLTDPQTWLAQHDPLRLIALRDPAAEATGHDPRSAYVEFFWLPIAGPSAVLAARRLVGWLERSPEAVLVALGPFARQLGLGAGTGRNAPITRTLARLLGFSLASARGDAYALRLAFPSLARRHLERLPQKLVEAHQRFMEERENSASNRVLIC
jgi:hypothetical protein